jgi:hypothetical protein
MEKTMGVKVLAKKLKFVCGKKLRKRPMHLF